MRYVQLIQSGNEDNPIEIIQQNGAVRTSEEILLTTESKVGFISGMIKNWSWNYRLKVNFYIAGREGGTFVLNPLQKLVIENKPCDRIILSIENTSTTTFAYCQYYLEQYEAEGDETIEMLYRNKSTIEDGDINRINGAAEEFVSTFQLNITTPPETILSACLANQDLLIKDISARVIGVPTPIKDADNNEIKRPTHAEIVEALNIKHNVKEDIPVNSLLGTTFLFRYADSQQLVRNEFTNYITKDNPELRLTNINFKAKRETFRGMNFSITTSPSGFTAGFVWLLILTVRFMRTYTPPVPEPAP